MTIIAGQWGTLKTFMWIDAAGSVMTGLPWTGEPVYRRGGVLAFTPEGAASIPLRLAAMIENVIAPQLNDSNIDLKRLPFEQSPLCPIILKDKTALNELWATAYAAHERFMKEFGVPLVWIVIDTMMAAAGWVREEDNAEVGDAWNTLRELSAKTGALVTVIDHFGKNQERGTRGGSAKEANSDAVLACLGERLPSGEIEDLRLAIRKQRDGPSGQEIAYGYRTIDMGVDEHNYPITQLVIDWAVQPKGRTSKANAAIIDALSEALAKHGRLEKLNGTEFKAVTAVRVREVFMDNYRGSPDDKKEGVGTRSQGRRHRSSHHRRGAVLARRHVSVPARG